MLILLVRSCFEKATWVVLGEARQRLGGVHTNIVFGEDDLAVQARAQRRSPRRGVKGQEVGGLRGGAPQEPTKRHLLRRGDAGSILWGAKEAVKVNNRLTSRNILSYEKSDTATLGRWKSRRDTRSTLPDWIHRVSAAVRCNTTGLLLLQCPSSLQLLLSFHPASRSPFAAAENKQTRWPFFLTIVHAQSWCANTLGRRPCEIPSSYQRPADVGASAKFSRLGGEG